MEYIHTEYIHTEYIHTEYIHKYGVHTRGTQYIVHHARMCNVAWSAT